MTNKLILAGVLVAALLTTCRGDTMSLYPFYQDHDLVSEEGLVGEWNGEGVRVIIRRNHGKGYEFTSEVTSGLWGGYWEGEIHLVRVAGSLFMDLSQRGDMNITGHHFGRVLLDGDSLQVTGFDPTWLHQKVVDEAALRYLDVPDGKVITAPTQELQWFVRQYVYDPSAFGAPLSFSRQPPDDVPAENQAQ